LRFISALRIAYAGTQSRVVLLFTTNLTMITRSELRKLASARIRDSQVLLAGGRFDGARVSLWLCYRIVAEGKDLPDSKMAWLAIHPPRKNSRAF